MKKRAVPILTVILLLVLAVPALAATMYTTKKVKVYQEPDIYSGVTLKLSGGHEVNVTNWEGGFCETRYGWIEEDYLSYEMPQKYCNHSWSKWKVTREATCTEKGSRTRTCSICNKKETESIKATGHDWGKWKVTKEATCSVKGTRTRTCRTCGKKETEEYYDDHTYGSWELTKAPTCTEKGARERTCKVCGHVDKQALDMVPHDYEYKVAVEATDHSAGVRAKVCRVCGKTTAEESFDPEGTLRRGARGEAVAHMQQLLVEQGYLNAGGADGIFGGGSEKALMKYQQDRSLNPDGIGWPQTLTDLEHDYGPWETVVEMTRTEEGERVRVCRGCGFEQRETIEPGEVFEFKRRGEDVRALQQMLTELGYNAGGYDGIYGKKLDAALAAFAAAHGIEVKAGEVRPADVDAVMNAWFASLKPEDWKGEGGVNSPVNLALTVTPTGEADDSGIQSYSWSLTNMGSQKVTYLALLLTFGDNPDFRQNNLVMNLDGIVLKPNAGNSASGTFNADADWGEGNLNFAALAVDENGGAKWLSNAVAFENAANPAEKTVEPQKSDIDVNHLPDGVYPVSFNRGDVFGGASGIYMNGVHVYSKDWYDIVDVSTLKAGDTIVVSGEAIPVASVEETEYGILVNGNQDDAIALAAKEDSVGFVVRGLDDMATYTEQGVTTLVLDPGATFTDGWDIEKEPVTVTGAEIVSAMQASENDSFDQYNTTVRVEGGKVVEINRIYVP